MRWLIGGPDESTNELMHEILANQLIQRTDMAANQLTVTTEIAATRRDLGTDTAKEVKIRGRRHFWRY